MYGVSVVARVHIPCALNRLHSFGIHPGVSLGVSPPLSKNPVIFAGQIYLHAGCLGLFCDRHAHFSISEGKKRKDDGREISG